MDREMKANRPDIFIKDKKERRCTLIDTTVPSEINTVPPQSLQRSCPGTKIRKLKSIGYEDRNNTSSHWSPWANKEGTKQGHL